MDKESDSTFTDDNNFSTISNEEISKYANSPDRLTKNYKNSNNSYKKKDSQYGNNSMLFNADNRGSNGAYSEDELKNYLLQLSQYLKQNNPSLLNVFQSHNNGDYEEEAGRMTPLQFSDNHTIIKLDFPGLMYQLSPNTLKHEGGIIVISDEIFPKSYDLQCDDYPGPLSIEKTTEDQIYSYLKDQMAMELQDTSPIDWDSGHLLINYLELMIKENGKPRIGNIVRLLNEGVETKTAELRKDSRIYDTISRNSFSRASSRATSRASTRPSSPNNLDSIDLDLPQNCLDTPQGPGSVTSMVRRAVVNASNDQKICQNMDRYRQYIVTGRFEEAVHFATKTGIWDHAFALALRMNNAQLTNEVLVSFSRRAIYSNDPLYTMHELMAQKAPKISAANRGFSNNEMGDWRCHLGMILAVKKYRPDECRQAIESMGEKLSALRSYYAAHLCFLLAGTQFGLDKSCTRYRRKFDLIGWQSSTSSIPAQKSSFANCNKLFTGLNYWNSAPEQCIKLTEVYEYALKFCNDNQHELISIHLLPYKYLMVYKMLSKNLVKNAYEYCINIGEILGYKINWLECESINFRIVSNIRDLSYRLNSWLTSFDDSDYSTNNNIWLSNIDNVYGLFCDKYQLWNPNNSKPDFTRTKTPEDDILFNQSQSGSLMYAGSGINGYSYAESVASSSYVDQYQPIQSDHSTNKQLYQTNQDIYNPNINLKPQHQIQQQQLVQQQQQQLQQQQLQQQQLLKQQSQQRQQLQQEQITYQQSQSKIGNNNSVYQGRSMPQTGINQQRELPGKISPLPESRQQTGQTQSLSRHQNDYAIQQNVATAINATIQPNNKFKYENNTTFRNIAPPSELPSEAIMTEPPKFVDMKHTTNSIVDRAHNNNYDTQRLRYEQTMKSQLNDGPTRSIKPQQYLTNDPSKYLSNNQILPPHQLNNETAIINKNINIQNDHLTGDYDTKLNSYIPGLNFPINNSPPKTTSKGKQFTFVPTNDMEDDSTVDCFTSYAMTSRSRSQSNGSVGSIENQTKSPIYPVGTRSRNSSESKDSITTPYQNVASRILEPTKEENDNSVPVDNDKSKQEQPETKSAKAGWSFLGLLKPKNKEVYLPKDNEKTMVYDKEKNRWIDTSNPESEKPLTPPPILPAIDIAKIQSTDAYQTSSANQFGLTKYRQAAINVKPSAPVAILPPNPIFNINQNIDSSASPTLQDSNISYSPVYNYNTMDYGVSSSSLNYGNDNHNNNNNYQQMQQQQQQQQQLQQQQQQLQQPQQLQYNNYNDQLYGNQMHAKTIANPRNF